MNEGKEVRIEKKGYPNSIKISLKKVMQIKDWGPTWNGCKNQTTIKAKILQYFPVVELRPSTFIFCLPIY